MAGERGSKGVVRGRGRRRGREEGSWRRTWFLGKETFDVPEKVFLCLLQSQLTRVVTAPFLLPPSHSSPLSLSDSLPIYLPATSAWVRAACCKWWQVHNTLLHIIKRKSNSLWPATTATGRGSCNNKATQAKQNYNSNSDNNAMSKANQILSCINWTQPSRYPVSAAAAATVGYAQLLLDAVQGMCGVKHCRSVLCHLL